MMVRMPSPADAVFKSLLISSSWPGTIAYNLCQIQPSRVYVPASQVGAELLFDVISTAYERSSVIVTTNLQFEEWKEVLGSERLTGATLDRLTHRCTIVETGKESYRLREARRRRRGASAEGA